MNLFFKLIERAIGVISDVILPLFLPFMLLLGLYLTIEFIVKIQPETSENGRFKAACKYAGGGHINYEKCVCTK